MGLFSFFKKKDDNETPKSETLKSELFLSLSKYNEYIVRFVGMQQQGNYAPISAYEKTNGEVVGFLYVNSDDDNSYSLSAQEVIDRMENSFRQKLANGTISSYVILYHSQFADDDNHQLANDENELKAITVSYNFKNGTVGKIGLRYWFEDDEITYKGFTNFSQDENNVIFATQLKENKDYFQEREEIKEPVYENEIGIKIKKSNSLHLHNTWCGIFGFESYQKPNGGQILIEYTALVMTTGKITKHQEVSISELDYDDISLKVISVHDNPKTILPVIKTDYVVDVVNNGINEWENIENLEAIITGKGRDTFGLTYFATDYAENREKYLSKKELKVKISGIAFVLDINKVDDAVGEVKYSEDFTAYLPNKDLPNYACFDFIGQLEDFKETFFLEDNSQKGYLMKVRLITDEIKDFFTIDIFVTPENMRFEELTKGMKLTGMFQMQGQIAE